VPTCTARVAGLWAAAAAVVEREVQKTVLGTLSEQQLGSLAGRRRNQ